MKSKEFVKMVSEKANISQKEASVVVDNVFESISDALKNGDSIRFNNFGTFKVVERKARSGRNPLTGDKIEIPARKAVKFVPSNTLKHSVK